MPFTSTLPAKDVTSTLPQEVIDEIVDYVSDHQKTQKYLSLVNRCWSHRTRHNLFQIIRFELGGRNCTRLSEVLQANPLLYRHIQTMRIDHNSSSSNLESPNILGVINRKELINVFYISLDGGMESKLHWGDLPPRLSSALYELLAKPDLITLALMNICDIDASKFIGQSRCLKNLGLHDVKHALSTSTSTPSSNASVSHLADAECSLRSLSVGDCGDALECFRPATVALSPPVWLKVLSHGYDDKMDTALEKFSRSVETYEIICTNGALPTRVPLHSGILDLARLPKLRILKINLHADQLWCLMGRPSATIPSPFVQQLDRLSGMNALEGIAISLHLDFPLGSPWLSIYIQLMTHSYHTDNEVSTWKDLDDTLSDRAAFPKLKKLGIALSFTSSAPPAHVFNLFADMFKVGILQKLNDRSMVEVINRGNFLS